MGKVSGTHLAYSKIGPGRIPRVCAAHFNSLSAYQVQGSGQPCIGPHGRLDDTALSVPHGVDYGVLGCAQSETTAERGEAAATPHMGASAVL